MYFEFEYQVPGNKALPSWSKSSKNVMMWEVPLQWHFQVLVDTLNYFVVSSTIHTVRIKLGRESLQNLFDFNLSSIKFIWDTIS